MLSSESPPVSVAEALSSSQPVISEGDRVALAGLQKFVRPHAAPPAPVRGLRDDVLDTLKSGPVTIDRIQADINADPKAAHIAKGPIELALQGLIKDGLVAGVMAGDPQVLHYRLPETGGDPRAVMERRSRVLATLAFAVIQGTGLSTVDDLSAAGPDDLEETVLPTLISQAADLFGEKLDAETVEADLDAFVSSGTLVASTDPEDDEEPSWTFATGKIVEWMIGAPSLVLASMSAAARAALAAPTDRTGFEREAETRLEAERETRIHVEEKLRRVYVWLRDKSIDTDALDARLDAQIAAPVIESSATIVLRKKKVAVTDSDLRRIILDVNNIADEEALLPQSVEDVKAKAKDLIKAAKETAERRAAELAAARADLVGSSAKPEITVEKRCRVEHDYPAGVVRYVDVETGKLFDEEKIESGPLFDQPPTPVAAAPAPAPDDAPGFTARPDTHAAEAAAGDEKKATRGAAVKPVKFSFTAAGVEAAVVEAIQSAGDAGLTADALEVAVLKIAGVDKPAPGMPAFLLKARKALMARGDAFDRDGYLVWTGDHGAEVEKPKKAAKKGGKGK